MASECDQFNDIRIPRTVRTPGKFWGDSHRTVYWQAQNHPRRGDRTERLGRAFADRMLSYLGRMNEVDEALSTLGRLLKVVFGQFGGGIIRYHPTKMSPGALRVLMFASVRPAAEASRCAGLRSRI